MHVDHAEHPRGRVDGAGECGEDGTGDVSKGYRAALSEREAAQDGTPAGELPGRVVVMHVPVLERREPPLPRRVGLLQQHYVGRGLRYGVDDTVRGRASRARELNIVGEHVDARLTAAAGRRWEEAPIEPVWQEWRPKLIGKAAEVADGVANAHKDSYLARYSVGCGSRLSRLAALGSEDWCDAIHAGVVSTADRQCTGIGVMVLILA